jgi:hypothetical protein
MFYSQHPRLNLAGNRDFARRGYTSKGLSIAAEHHWTGLYDPEHISAAGIANLAIETYASQAWFLRPCQTKHFCLSDSPFARRTNRILPLDPDVVSHVR